MRLPDGWQNVDQRWQWHYCRGLSLLAGVFVPGKPFLPFVLQEVDISSGERKKASWTLHMLDVGQGLAMVIERQGKPFSMIPGSPGRAGIARSG
jgi:competence protein ComEC